MAASNWLLLVIIAKFFAPELLGQFVIALSLTTPIFLFTSFKLRTVLMVDRVGKYSLADYLHARFWSNSLAILLVVLAGRWFFPDIPGELFWILAIHRWGYAWSELAYSFMHKISCFKLAAQKQLLRSVLSTLTLVMASMLGEGWLTTLWLWALAGLLVALFDVLNMVMRWPQSPDSGILLRACLAFAPCKQALAIYRQYFTLSVSLVLGALGIYLPNFFIEHHVGVEAAGQFAAVSYFLVAGALVIQSLSQVLAPRMNALVSNSNWSGLTILTLKSMATGMVIGLAGIVVAQLFGGFFLQLFYTGEIAELQPELVLVMTAAAIKYIYIFITTAMNARHEFSSQTRIYAIGTFSTLVFCYLLIPEFGTLGAGWAMLLAALTECVLFVVLFIKGFNRQPAETPAHE